MYGICIHDENVNYTDMILSGIKTIETRNGSAGNFKAIIGQRIALISMKPGKVREIVGTALLSDVKSYNTAVDFNSDYELHRVSPCTEYSFENSRGLKCGLVLSDVKRVYPAVPVQGKELAGQRVYKPLTYNA